MKIEQACRFRTSEGYGITARSDGFDKAQENVLAELFNDSMRQLFSRLGTSLLSCAVQGSYAFYSRNTLRTHENREVIFTHSYVLPAQTYADMMCQMPERLLAVPMSALMEVQTCGANMEQADFPGSDYEPLSLDALFEKYRLTPQRYSRLLMGAYEAMTGSRTLQLCTGAPLEEREQVVRELTYCIVTGLLPVMKGKVTFSSGSDTRMNISLLPAGSAGQNQELVFGVDDDRYTTIRFRDELTSSFFQALGDMSHERRREVLEGMEDWLREITDVENDLTLMMICISYVYNSGKAITSELSLSLFRSIVKAANKALSIRSANAMLTELIESQVEQGAVSTNLLSIAAQWYLMDSSDAFRCQTDKALAMASEEIRVALVEAVTHMSMTANARQMVRVLMEGMLMDSPELTEKIRLQLLQWILQQEPGELKALYDALCATLTPPCITALAKQILAVASERSCTSAELSIVCEALNAMPKHAPAPGQLSDAQTLFFCAEDYQRLDAHMGEFDEDGMKVLVYNCLNTRIRMLQTGQERLELLLRLGRANQTFDSVLTDCIIAARPTGEDALLWEAYRTERILGPGVTAGQLQELCWRYNVFQNPNGEFEKRVVRIWSKDARARLDSQIRLDDPIRRADEEAKALLKAAERLEVSKQTRDKLKNLAINEFWERVRYDQILNSGLKISFELRIDDINLMESTFKCALATACGQLVSGSKSTRELVKLIRNYAGYGVSDVDLRQIQDMMYELTKRLTMEKKWICWDLLLLRSWRGEGDYDFDQLSDDLLDIGDWIEAKDLRLSQTAYQLSDSTLLSTQHRELRKSLQRNLSQESWLARNLVRELKTKGREGAGAQPTAPSRQSTRRPEPREPEQERRTRPHQPGTSTAGRNPFTQEPPEQKKKGFFNGLFDQFRKEK